MSKRSRDEFETDWKSQGVSEETINRLDSKNITKMLEIQSNTYKPLMEGKSIIGRSLTGSGKTQAFIVPVVEKFKNGTYKHTRNPKVMVLNPTRELVLQTYKNSELLTGKSDTDDFSLKMLKLQGGTDWRQNQQDLERGADLIISTPGRTIDCIERGYLNMDEIKCIILDEADRMLDMGFKDEIYKIMKAVKNKDELQFVLISATINDYFIQVLKDFDIKYDMIDLVKGREVIPKKIKHLKIKCPNSNLQETIADVITVYAGANNKSIVFCPRKQTVNDILSTNKIKSEVAVIHGDIPQKQREVSMNLFRQGKVMTLLTTDVCARGIDLPDLDLVIQIEPPGDVESYVHRSGRTGRNGREGTCITFYTQQNKHQLERIEKVCKTTFEKLGPIQSTDIMAASCRDATVNLDKVYNNLNDEILNHFTTQSDEIIEKQTDQRKLIASLLCIVGGVDNTLNLSSKSFISGQEKYKTYQLELQQSSDISNKSLLFRIINTALDAYNQTSFEDKEMMAVNIAKDFRSFFFDIQEDSIENFKALFTEDGMIKQGIGKRLGCKITEITSTQQLNQHEDTTNSYNRNKSGGGGQQGRNGQQGRGGGGQQGRGGNNNYNNNRSGNSYQSYEINDHSNGSGYRRDSGGFKDSGSRGDHSGNGYRRDSGGFKDSGSRGGQGRNNNQDNNRGGFKKSE